MALNGPTLLLTLIVTSALSGCLLLWVWRQNRQVRALWWWGLAYFCAALGVTLAAGRGNWHDRLSIDLANVLVFIGYGLMWIGTRAFTQKRPTFAWVVVPAAIWLIACQIPAFYTSLPARAIFYSFLCVIVMMAIAREFLAIGPQFPSRVPLAVVMTLHSLFFVVRLVGVLLTPEHAWTAVWLPVTAFAGIMFVFASGFLLLGMAKARTELQYRLASERDYLTNAANRRGFYSEGERRLAEASETRAPTCLLVFDLDGFKQVNDLLGHQAGDRVLQIFGAVAAECLRKTDVFARLGGDEFAALLTHTREHEADEIAARIVARFREVCRDMGPVSPPVEASVGMAVSGASQVSLDDLVDLADQALYRGRERMRALD